MRCPKVNATTTGSRGCVHVLTGSGVRHVWHHVAPVYTACYLPGLSRLHRLCTLHPDQGHAGAHRHQFAADGEVGPTVRAAQRVGHGCNAMMCQARELPSGSQGLHASHIASSHHMSPYCCRLADALIAAFSSVKSFEFPKFWVMYKYVPSIRRFGVTPLTSTAEREAFAGRVVRPMYNTTNKHSASASQQVGGSGKDAEHMRLVRCWRA